MKRNDKSWIIHLVLRLIAIPALFVIIYWLMLDGRGDPMGLGLVYAILIQGAAGILLLGIEAIVLYRKKVWSKFYCNIGMLLIALFFILNLLTGK